METLTSRSRLRHRSHRSHRAPARITCRRFPPASAVLTVCLVVVCWTARPVALLGQAEVAAWGNLAGIRMDGELMAFETSLVVVSADSQIEARTRKEGQRPRYHREGGRRTVTTQLAPYAITQIIDDGPAGEATVGVRLAAQTDTSVAGAFFRIDAPLSDYGDGSLQFLGTAEPDTSGIPLPGPTGIPLEGISPEASGARLTSSRRRLEIRFDRPARTVARRAELDGRPVLQLDITLHDGPVAAGDSVGNTFSLVAGGEIDRSPVTFTVDPRRPGRAFDGLGGNFRIQNPSTDPQVIAYNLENLRVAWGRVEMPWGLWHPEESVDPVAAAESGHLHPRVHAAMDMARTLAKRRIPVIASAWFPPAWAVLGDPRDAYRPRPGGLRGNALDPEKMDRIVASIGAYLSYMKRVYGVEAVAFSFNESDLGIDVRQTGPEHADLIKRLGAHLVSIGLSTKLLLGDTSDARPIAFIQPALDDPETWPYIHSVSFHSWRGCTDERLARWSAAARKLNVPLLVGEGSTDAAAWTYPEIFLEPAFAHYEIDLYTRILARSEPLSILQWQLTADYSLLAGGGIFGDTTPLRPTQRFWNLKQLASTPPGAFALPLSSDPPGFTSAAFGDIANGSYAIHIVNNGATRPATVQGLPHSVTELRLFVTDPERGMAEGPRVPVVDGAASFTLDATSFTSLISPE